MSQSEYRQLSKGPTRAFTTHKGVKGKENQDSVLLFKVGPAQDGAWDTSPQQAIYVAVVADGVSSRASGAKASQLAVETIAETLRLPTLSVDLKPRLEKAIAAANAQIRAVVQASSARTNGMATTVALAAVHGWTLTVAHVGDSRVYLIRDRSLYLLTLDHSWIQAALDAGRFENEQQAKEHPNRKLVLRTLDGGDKLEVDFGIIAPGTNRGPSQRVIRDLLELKPGDAVLICSDGLIDKLADEHILAVLRKYGTDPQAAADELVNAALAENEDDNITAALLVMPSSHRRLRFPALFISIVIALGLTSALASYSVGGGPIALLPTSHVGTSPSGMGDRTSNQAKQGPVPSKVAVHSDFTTTATIVGEVVEDQSSAVVTTPQPTRGATPTQITPTPTPTYTPTSTPTAMPTFTPVPTATRTPRPTATATTTLAIALTAAPPITDEPVPVPYYFPSNVLSAKVVDEKEGIVLFAWGEEGQPCPQLGEHNYYEVAIKEGADGKFNGVRGAIETASEVSQKCAVTAQLPAGVYTWVVRNCVGQDVDGDGSDDQCSSYPQLSALAQVSVGGSGTNGKCRTTTLDPSTGKTICQN